MNQQENIIQDERKIGFPGHRNFLPYYTNKSWNGTEDSFYYFSVAPGNFIPELYLYDVAAGESKKCFDITFCKNEEDIHRLMASVFLIKRGMVILFHENRIITADLKTGEMKLRYIISNEYSGSFCISQDERYLAFASSPDKGFIPTTVHIIDTMLPEWQETASHTIDMHINHFQFFPNGHDILFAHEGVTTAIPDRLNLLNWKTGKYRCLHKHEHDENGNLAECIGHEHVAGNKVVAVRYPESQIDFGIIVVDPETEKCDLVQEGDFWHSASNKDGSRFVMDTMWWANSRRKTPNLIDIVMYDVKTQKKHVLKTFHANPLGRYQMYHSHPHTNDIGNRVLFTVRPVGKETECHIELLLLK